MSSLSGRQGFLWKTVCKKQWLLDGGMKSVCRCCSHVHCIDFSSGGNLKNTQGPLSISLKDLKVKLSASHLKNSASNLSHQFLSGLPAYFFVQQIVNLLLVSQCNLMIKCLKSKFKFSGWESMTLFQPPGFSTTTWKKSLMSKKQGSCTFLSICGLNYAIDSIVFI